jgi:integrase
MSAIQETQEFFSQLSINELLPIEYLDESFLHQPLPSNNEFVEVQTTTPQVSNVVLSNQAQTTRKAMDRAVAAFLFYNTTNPISEENILAWLNHISPNYAPTSLWTMYSLLKKYLLWEMRIDLGKAPLIQQFLKTLSKTHKKKHAPAFTREEVFAFLDTPTTPETLWKKLAVLFAVYGALRTSETIPITWADIQEIMTGIFLFRSYCKIV